VDAGAGVASRGDQKKAIQNLTYLRMPKGYKVYKAAKMIIAVVVSMFRLPKFLTSAMAVCNGLNLL
jgi:hypothetical protein